MRFIIDMKLDNWNDTIKYCRGNKYGANFRKQKEMKDIASFMIGLPKIKDYPVEIIFRWHIKSNNSDLDNKSSKAILDSMQKIGILENDNIKHINKITNIAIPDKKDYVEVEIKVNK